MSLPGAARRAWIEGLLPGSFHTILVATLSPEGMCQLQPGHVHLNPLPPADILNRGSGCLRPEAYSSLVPFGLFASLRLALRRIWRVVFSGGLRCLIIETLRLFGVLRGANMDDVILNSFGCVPWHTARCW